jgi:hypothetical protein
MHISFENIVTFASNMSGDANVLLSADHPRLGFTQDSKRGQG